MHLQEGDRPAGLPGYLTHVPAREVQVAPTSLPVFPYGQLLTALWPCCGQHYACAQHPAQHRAVLPCTTLLPTCWGITWHVMGEER